VNKIFPFSLFNIRRYCGGITICVIIAYNIQTPTNRMRVYRATAAAALRGNFPAVISAGAPVVGV